MSAQAPVFLLAETGFIIRNLLLGYFASEVIQKHPLIVAVPIPDDPTLKSVAKEIGFDLVPYLKASSFGGLDPRSNWERFFSWDNWMYGIRGAMRQTQSYKIQTRLFEGHASWKKKVLRAIPYWVGKRVVKPLHLSGKLEDFYLHKYIGQLTITQQWKDLFMKVRPVVLFSTMLSHGTRFRHNNDLPAVVAAHQLGIPVVTLIQSWDNLSSKVSVLPPWLRRYYVWSATMKNELLQYHPRIRPSQVEIVGSPQYDFHRDPDILMAREMYMRSKGLDPDRPYILIGTGTPKWMPNEIDKVLHLTYRINAKWPQMQVMIRLHPKDYLSRWEDHVSLFPEGVVIVETSPPIHMDKGGFVPPQDFYQEQVNAIYHASVVLNSSSSLTVDAAILDRPIICIAYDLEKDPLFPEGRAYAYSKSEHYSKLVATGGVWVATSEEECLRAIETYWRHPELHRQERRFLVDVVTDDIHQKSGIRLAKALFRDIQLQ